MILFYISGHGFGHMSRESAVIGALHKLSPEIKIGVKTSAPRWFAEESVPAGTMIDFCSIDAGVVQADSLKMDIEETLKRYAKLIGDKEGIITREVSWCRENGVELIVADIVPFAFDIADKLRIPSVCIANFSWDWIYEPYVLEYPPYKYVVDDIRKSEAKCTLCLKTPFAGDLSAFPRIADIPLICRESQLSRQEARRIAGLPDDKTIVLFSFGGFGLDDIEDAKPDIDSDTVVVVTQPDIEKEDWIYFPREELKRRGLKYQDLVRAADVVITKPGYGIVTECIANDTAMVYVKRDDFAEYPVLAEAVEKHLSSSQISLKGLLGGKWKEAIGRALDSAAEEIITELSGAEEAAAVIAGYCRD
ncbi:MAG: hypothetical protein H8E46_11080 [FCB group bacterium]|nr:hypothetical protein [FCB group bacterium]